MYYNKGVLWAKLESTFDADAIPTAADAIEVIDPQFTPDFNRITRQIMEGHGSPKPSVIARKLANLQFQVEVKGWGNNSSEGKLGRLLRACWMSSSQVSAGADDANSVWDVPIPLGATPTGKFTFTKTGTYAGAYPRRVVIRCTTPGGTGVAAFQVSSPAVGDGAGGNAAIDNSAVVMTDSVSFALAQGAAITPTIGTSFAAGDMFVFWCVPDGFLYKPLDLGTSPETANQSVTLYYYRDGSLHIMTGCRGSVSLDATAGEIGLLTFNFVGSYVDAQQGTFPTTNTFDTTEPPTVENAQLYLPILKHGTATNLGKPDTTLCVASFGFDLANTVVPRQCVSANEGNEGSKVSSRAPTATADPEFVAEDSHGFWKALENAYRFDMGAVIGGGTVGNAVAWITPCLQAESQPYGERDGDLILDLSAVASRVDPNNGNDEVAIWVG